MEFLVEIFFILTTFGFLFYKWATKNYRFFSHRNIAHEKPIFLIGNALPILTAKESLLEMFTRLHKQFQNEKIYGFYGWRKPYFFIRDPELIKKITVKDFSSFINHDNHNAQAISGDETIGNMLTMLKDQKWKVMRNTLTPVFTGNKLRQVFQIINECSVEAMKYLKEKAKKEPEINIADFFHQYSNDVIASAAFGLKINPYQKDETEFSKMGAALLKPEGFGVIVKSIFFAIFPQIAKALKINIIDMEALNYLKSVVSHTIRQRKEHEIIRQDMIHLMLESQKHALPNTSENKTDDDDDKWTENEMVAQCILFLFAGLGPMSSMLCSATYELMKNSEVQEKLFEEISKANNELNGSEISYDSLKNMKYLDMVVSETLRKWPSAPFLDRVCSKSYTLTDDDNTVIAEFKAGDNVLLSVYGSHFDEKNFPKPLNFDPERFNDENKANIKPFTYFPFGLGPRSCIGDRFGLMVGKMILYQLLLHIKLSPSPKSTPDILEASRGLKAKVPEMFWMNLHLRE